TSCRLMATYSVDERRPRCKREKTGPHTSLTKWVVEAKLLPFRENKQRGRESDVVQAGLCGFVSRRNRDEKSEVVKVKWEEKWQKRDA
ncbi:MAG: hypothetical protein RSC60_05245, partial [Christensenellaceae bacterium]